jgi:beta-galactosidase
LPSNLLLGVAIAGFQADPGCPTIEATRCEDRLSDWSAWVTTPELIAERSLALSGDPLGAGPGFFELYPQDLDRIGSELHVGALRISLEWSRIFPTSTVGLEGDALARAANPDALAYYHALLGALRARGLKPLVTINHYTLPSWIHDPVACHRDLAGCARRGWLDADVTIREITKYAGFVAREFGGEVDLWATLNEPVTATALSGYVAQLGRSSPPGAHLQWDAFKAVVRAEIEAHARMVDAVRAADTIDADGDGRAALVGLVYNVETIVPHHPDRERDARGADNLTHLLQGLFLDATLKGDLDANFDGHTVHRDDLAGRADFLGVNYYARLVVDGTDGSLLPQVSPLLTFDLLGLEPDYTHPEAIYDALLWTRRYGLPIFVTETGTEDPADDGSGPRWIVRSLDGVRRAAAAGVNLAGYFYWTLTDNYEWNQGMHARLGLYAVDAADPRKTRRARAGVGVYGEIAQSRAISPALWGRFGGP